MRMKRDEVAYQLLEDLGDLLTGVAALDEESRLVVLVQLRLASLEEATVALRLRLSARQH